MATVYERQRGLSRRDVLRRGGALGASALLVISGSAVINPEQAWGLETKALKPETMATLIQIVAQDRPALLYDITSTISTYGCNIEVVLIDTEAHKAIDVFYVTRDGRKLPVEMHAQLRDALLQCLA